MARTMSTRQRLGRAHLRAEEWDLFPWRGLPKFVLSRVMHLRGGATDGDPDNPLLDDPEPRTIHARRMAHDVSLCGKRVIPLVCQWHDQAILHRCPTCAALSLRPLGTA